MFNLFWQKEKILIGFTGLVATLGALFLNIPVPAVEDARLALANIQVFWLVLLTLSLTKLFFSFTALVIKTERDIKRKYDLPVGAFSLTIGITFLVVIGNFWRYIIDLYGKSFFDFMNIIFPALVAMACMVLLLYVEKNRGKFTRFSYIIILSFIIAALTSVVGVYLQQTILGYFYFYWLNCVLPGAFIFFVAGLTIYSLLKKRSLFEVLPLEISVYN